MTATLTHPLRRLIRLPVEAVAMALMFVCLIAPSALKAEGHKPAQSESNSTAELPLIEAGASENAFSIEPTFDGTNIVMFGAINREQLKSDHYDIAVILHGPTKPLIVWKKQRLGPVWINAKSYTFQSVPNFFAVLSSRPLEEMATAAERKPYQLGFDVLNLPTPSEPSANANQPTPSSDEFRSAIIRLKQSQNLFVAKDNAIEFMGKSLFRVKVFLPAAAGPGLYQADILLIQNGKIIATTMCQIRFKKVGLESFLSSLSARKPTIYGFGAVSIAALVGLGASALFRRRS